MVQKELDKQQKAMDKAVAVAELKLMKAAEKEGRDLLKAQKRQQAEQQKMSSKRRKLTSARTTTQRLKVMQNEFKKLSEERQMELMQQLVDA